MLQILMGVSYDVRKDAKTCTHRLLWLLSFSECLNKEEQLTRASTESSTALRFGTLVKLWQA